MEVVVFQVAEGLVAPCRFCGAGNVIPHGSVATNCTNCGNRVITYSVDENLMLATCPRCKAETVSEIPKSRGFPGVRMTCSTCSVITWSSDWIFEPSSDAPKSGVTHRDFGRYSASENEVTLLLSNPDRRIIRGEIISISGVSGMAKGRCSVVFDMDVVRIAIEHEPGFHEISYDSVQSLQFAGRGHHTVSSGARVIGGGFGLEGAAVGMMEAAFANAVIKKATKQRLIETIVTLQWASGSLVLFIADATPQDVAARLQVVVARLKEAANKAAPAPAALPSSDLVSQIKELAALREQGVISDAEFAAAKAKLLGLE